MSEYQVIIAAILNFPCHNNCGNQLEAFQIKAGIIYCVACEALKSQESTKQKTSNE